ncbi:vanomycin resistance protein VanB [Amycolatopsis sp. K13G38]|uniref:Vanomycin resistance protein VanB n=1 Tax=Amycolatopsis acididurans TaxID=2724524 RepID=A0ABX1J385_9PSEU|nr:VanW family protein [Amycolatopsis acididurans]NKQ54119.1 vanomycin resistance protein VanB [Amycolatopsis acididurans]
MQQEPSWPTADDEKTEVFAAVTEVIPPVKPSRDRKGLKRAGIVAGSVLGVLAALYAIDLLVSQGNVPRGVTVAGVEVGGLQRSEAEQKLRTEIEPRLVKPVAVRAGDVQATVDPARAGLTLDWASTLDQAGSQPLNPFTRIGSFFSTREVGVVTRADRPQLVNTLANLRDQTDRDPVEGTIRFEGVKPVAVDPKPGQHLDVENAANEIVTNWASGQPVELPVQATPVAVSAENVQKALHELAEPAVSAPVKIRGDGADATVAPEALATALRFEPEGDALTMKVDNNKIIEAAGPQLKSTEKQGKDAQIVFDGGRPNVSESVDGKGVDWNPTLEPLPELLQRADGREIVAKYVNTPAKVTTDQAKALGINEVIGEFTTGGFASDSGVNIRAVAEKVNGAIVKPGETFSLNGFTGPRGAAQGYVEAGVIENGAPAREVGGGISQFATTLYNASYFAGMKDAGHKEHSYYISRYPAAREATVFESPNGASVIDLKFTNDAPTGVAIQTIWTPSSITVKLWGTKRYNVESVPGQRTNFVDPQTKPGPADNCHPSNGAPGFTTTDTRILRDAGTGAEVRRDTRTVHYNPQPKITCGP